MIQVANQVARERGSSSNKAAAVVVGVVSGASDVKDGMNLVARHGTYTIGFRAAGVQMALVSGC